MTVLPLPEPDNLPVATSKWGALGVVLIGIVMSTLDTTVVNVTLPTIAHEFQTSLSNVAWVVIAYSLAMSIMVVPVGRLAELVGFRAVYLWGFVVFTGGSVLCALAPDLGWLVGARIIQSMGGASILAVGGAVISLSFPPHQRGRALGTVPVAAAVGISSGPVLGGLLTEYLSWHWVFWVNVPIGLIAGVLSLSVLHPTSKTTRWWVQTNWRSIVLLSLLAGAFVIGTNLPLEGERGWSDPWVLGLLVATLPLAYVFVRADRRSRRPLVPFADLRNRRLLLSILAGASSLTLVMANTYLMNWHMQGVQGFGPGLAGQVLLTSPVCLSLLGPVSGWFCDRFGDTLPKYLGIGLAFAGTFTMSLLSPADPPTANVLALGLFSAGMGLYQTPNNHVVYSSIARESMSRVSAFSSAIRIFGGTMGTVLSTVILGTMLVIYLGDSSLLPAGPSSGVRSFEAISRTNAAFRITFRAMSVVPLVMLVLTIAADRRPPFGGAALPSPRESGKSG